MRLRWLSLVSLVLASACDRRPLRSLTVTLHLETDARPDFTVYVELSKPGTCFVAPPDTRVSLNGEVLTAASLGGKLGPPAYGIFANCEPVFFRSQPFVAQPFGRDVVTIEMGGGRARVEVDGLRGRRTLHLSPPGPLISGRDVTLHYLAGTDVWPGKSLDEKVRLEPVGDLAAAVDVPATHIARTAYQFVVPSLRPGAVTIYLRTGKPGPSPHVAVCSGVDECGTSGIIGPEPFVAEVAALPGDH